jgi:hypothetical protein
MDLQSFLATRLACSSICFFLLDEGPIGCRPQSLVGRASAAGYEKERLSAHDDTSLLSFDFTRMATCPQLKQKRLENLGYREIIPRHLDISQSFLYFQSSLPPQRSHELGDAA